MTDFEDRDNQAGNEGVPEEGSENERGHEKEKLEQDGSKRGRPVKIVISQGAQEVKFADLFGYTLTPTHAVIKFGTLQPETGEFVVHTQIAMTPQGMVALSQGLQENLEKVRKIRSDGAPKLN